VIDIERFSPRARFAAGLGSLLVVAVLISVASRGTPDDGSTLADGPRVTAPRGVRIKVQVLNGSGVTGLAARATRYLRDRGFDVVESGNYSEKLDSTLVLDRGGKGEWARLVARALGVPLVETRPDSTRLVDVTVVLGSDWIPPSGAFSP
jgi:hypothetical protein